ncbi:MAG: PBP1A family penicillin-binding protein [Thermoanaerobaculia bacterium]
MRDDRDELDEPATSPRRWLRFVVPLLIVVALGALAGIAVAAVIHMPRVDSLADFTPALITSLRDSEGGVFATYASERRIMLSEDEIPDVLRQAVLSAEDSNFFQHGGIDPEGVLRAALRNMAKGTRIGGSTLTMQLARKLYLTPEKTWRRKIEEALLTVEIEKNFTKQQILTLYCNLMYLGHGNYGMAAAARSYFGKSVGELTVPEAATLAGILQRPGSYSPYRRPDLVLKRRDYVLGRMLEEGYIDRATYEQAIASALELAPARADEAIGAYFAEDVRRYLEERYGTETLLQRGLQVHTTLDPRVQAAAEEALRYGLTRLDHRRGWRGPIRRLGEGEAPESVELPGWRGLVPEDGLWAQGIVLSSDGREARVRIGETIWTLDRDGVSWARKERVDDLLARGDVAWFRFETGEGENAETVLRLEQEPLLEGAVVVLDSATGAVRAMVGGWNFGRSQFNRASQAMRQTGSAFKPFVYGAALEMGYTPADTIFDAPVVFPGATVDASYSPRNFYRRYFGIVTLREALEHSYNVSAVKLASMVGLDRVIDFAHRAGITSDLPPYPSLALGVADLTPLELAGAYASIANQGIHMEPYLIDSVEDPAGNVLERHAPRAQKAMEPQIAYLLTHILEGVIDRGTGASAARLPLDLAGKTGTQDRFTDAWFAGFTPRLTIVAWVGYDEKKSIGYNMTGAEAALPIWKRVVEDGLAQGWIAEGETFAVPPGVTMIPVEAHTGLLPGSGATSVIDEAFLDGTQPTQQFDAHWARVMQLPWYQQRPFYLPKDGEAMPDDIDDWGPVRAAWAEKEARRGG